MNIIVDLDENKIYSAPYVRELLLNEEIQDIINNKKDYISGCLNIESQCKCIEYAINGDINEIIRRLNDLWGYNIKSAFKGE